MDNFAAMLSFLMLFNIMPLFSLSQGHAPDFRSFDYKPHEGLSTKCVMRPDLIIMDQPNTNILLRQVIEFFIVSISPVVVFPASRAIIT